MQIIQASPQLVSAVQTMIAVGMASHLMRRAADLQDDTAVTVTLAQAGFGASSIRALRACAVSIARHTKAAARTNAH